MRSKRLSRQLKKSFGGEDIEESLTSAAPQLAQISSPEEIYARIKELVDNFPSLLDSIDETYQQLEERANLAQRSLEVSSAELTESNSKLFRLNTTFDAMLNSLGQGFVLFGRDGICLDVFSQASESLLEIRPAGKSIMDVLRVGEKKREAFMDWINILFQDNLVFEEFALLGPKFYEHTQQRVVSLEFKPVRQKEGAIEYIILIATDLTKEVEANKRAEEMQAYATMVAGILKNKSRFLHYVADFRKLTQICISLIAKQNFEMSDLLEVKRHLHGLKGASGMFGLIGAQKKIHDLETGVGSFEVANQAQEFLRKEMPALSTLFESILRENAEVIGDISESGPAREISLEKLRKFEERFSKNDEMHEVFWSEFIAMPAFSVFERFNAVVRQTAKSLGKNIADIQFAGENLLLVPEECDALLNNLAHVFRNIADHGIELPEERLRRGKQAEGQITIRFSKSQHTKKNIRVEISDDGGGINLEAIKRKLIDQGKKELAESGSSQELMNAIFLPGFSTAKNVTEISGRGIGLEAVKSAVTDLGGTIKVSSEAGKGTTFIIEWPAPSMIR